MYPEKNRGRFFMHASLSQRHLAIGSAYHHIDQPVLAYPRFASGPWQEADQLVRRCEAVHEEGPALVFAGLDVLLGDEVHVLGDVMCSADA